MGKISYIERRKRNFSIKILKIEKRKRIFLQNLINREEKEKFFLKILKFEKRKRIWFSNSWKSRKEREMKIQFSRPREKKMSHFSRHFSRDRDSCHRLHPTRRKYCNDRPARSVIKRNVKEKLACHVTRAYD